MSVGPVSGNGIPINIPPDKLVWWSALAQSSGNQFVQLKDSGGNVIFTAQGASSSGGTPTQIGQDNFRSADPSGNYTIYLGTNGGAQWSRVLWSEDSVNSGTTIYLGKYIFAAEDGGDNDYNDTYLELQWFQFSG